MAAKHPENVAELQKYLEHRGISARIGDKTGVSKISSRFNVSGDTVRDILRKTGWELQESGNGAGRFWRPKSLSTKTTDIL